MLCSVVLCIVCVSIKIQMRRMWSVQRAVSTSAGLRGMEERQYKRERDVCALDKTGGKLLQHVV